jgi:hypothetical protein
MDEGGILVRLPVQGQELVLFSEKSRSAQGFI